MIKPKLSKLDTKEDSTDLVETNREYLKEIFTENHLEELRKKYTLDLENQEKNVYNFIDVFG